MPLALASSTPQSSKVASRGAASVPRTQLAPSVTMATPSDRFHRLPNVASNCYMNAVLQCFLSFDSAFRGRGPISRAIWEVSMAGPNEPVWSFLESLISQCGFPMNQHHSAAEAWEALSSRIFSTEDGGWGYYGGSMVTRIHCLGCGNTSFPPSCKSWLWEIPMQMGSGTVSEGCTAASATSSIPAKNTPLMVDGFACSICQNRSAPDLRSDCIVSEQWYPSGPFVAIHANWASQTPRARVLEKQISTRLTLANQDYELVATICNVAAGSHYVAVVGGQHFRWRLDDALPPSKSKGWCANGIPEILLYRLSPGQCPPLDLLAGPRRTSPDKSDDEPRAAFNVITLAVNKLSFSAGVPKADTSPPRKLRLPASERDWSDLVGKLKGSLPSTLSSSNVDPRLSAAMITDTILESLPTQEPRSRRVRPASKPSHLRNANDLKRRARYLRRQQGPSPATNHDFFQALHLHSHLGRVVQAADRFDGLAANMARFHANPPKFAKETLDGSDPAQAKQVQVSPKEAEDFFRATYSDARNAPLDAPPSSTVSAPPIDVPFNENPISLAELRHVLRKKSNKGAPGPDGIPYVLYKRSPELQRALVVLFNDVIRTGLVPASWGTANIVLIPKSSGIVNDVKELRPIALTNTMGKLFTAILARRLESFLRANLSWDTSQKGFASATQGCIDHAFTVQQTLQDARYHQRSIAVAWLDLKNAYGSISHKMVQFALRQYSVPLRWCHIIFALYDHLCARVTTPAWSTNYFPYHKGVFQGDPLSPVIFNMAFSPVIAQIKELNKHPYVTACGVAVGVTAYADDLTIVCSTVSQLQHVIDGLGPLMAWLRLSFNPKKCVGLILTRGAVASPAPTLFVNQLPITNLVPPQTFKFLGVQIPANGDLKPVFETVHALAKKYWDAITKAPVTIPAKVEIFKFSLTRLRWLLTVYDWPMRDVESLQAIANSYLRSWLHLPHSANLFVVYSLKALHVPLVTTVFKASQVSKHLNLQGNKDPDVAKLHAHRRIDHRAKWFVDSAMTAIQSFIAAEDYTSMMLGVGNKGRTGLGSKSQSSLRAKTLARRVSRFIAEEECSVRLAEVMQLDTYKDLWGAIECDMAADKHWQRALFGLPDKLLTFALAAATNSLPTRRNMCLWRKMTSWGCPLCGKMQTLGHVLNACPTALAEGRYNFRHDLVLGVFVNCVSQSLPDLAIHFMLDYVSDSRKYVFPLPVHTSLRPDAVVTSKDGATIWILELTVPLPHRVSESNSLKVARYQHLADELTALGRVVHLLAWEVSSFGNVAHSTSKVLRALGLTGTQRRSAMVTLSQAAIRGSYVVFQHRDANCMPLQPLLSMLPALPLPRVNLLDTTQPPAGSRPVIFVAGGLMPTDVSFELQGPSLPMVDEFPICSGLPATSPPQLRTEEPPGFPCPACEVVLRSSQGLALHRTRWCKAVERDVVPAQPSSLAEQPSFVCSSCARTFSSQQGLNLHNTRWCPGR